MSFCSSLRSSGSGMPLNCRSGVCDSHMRLSTILHRLSVFSASAAQPRLSVISKSARRMRAADCCTYTMSATSAKPSSERREMYACSSTLILAEGSPMFSLTGMGTRPSSLASSSFSSSRTTMFRNSCESEKSRKSSISESDGRRCSLKVAIEWCVT